MGNNEQLNRLDSNKKQRKMIEKIEKGEVLGLFGIKGAYCISSTINKEMMELKKLDFTALLLHLHLEKNQEN